MRGWVKRGNLSPRRACYRKPALRQNRRLIRKCRQHKGKGPAQGHDPPVPPCAAEGRAAQGSLPYPCWWTPTRTTRWKTFPPCAMSRRSLRFGGSARLSLGVSRVLAPTGGRQSWRIRTGPRLPCAARVAEIRAVQLERPSPPYACWRATSSEKTPPLAMSSS